MTINELLYSVKTDSFSRMVPFSEITSEETLKELQAQGHQVAYTKDSFLKSYPTLDPTKIFSIPGISCSCYYFDEETMVIFPIHLYGTELLGNYSLEELVQTGISSIKDALKKQKFSFLFTAMSDLLRLEYLEKLISRGMVSDPFSLFQSVYTSSDYGCSVFSEDFLKNIFSLRTPEQKASLKKALSSLPDKVTVYRGMGERSSSESAAFSWTMDPGTAMHFALWHTDRDAQICKGFVNKEDILAVFDDRNEAEVLIWPGKVFGKTFETFYGLDWLKQQMPAISKDYLRYKNQARYEDLPFLQQSKIHNKEHAARVLFHCVILGQLLKVTRKEMAILAEAALYHDVGRMTDAPCRIHGAKSAECYEQAVSRANPVVLFLMKYHCLPDEDGYEEIRRNPVLAADAQRVTLLFNIFKDADGLDRVRLGLKSLDYTQLRTSEAKKLPYIAKICLENLHI